MNKAKFNDILWIPYEYFFGAHQILKHYYKLIGLLVLLTQKVSRVALNPTKNESQKKKEQEKKTCVYFLT